MLGKDAAWYLKNSDKISAFRKYIALIENDILPRSIGRLALHAAREAIDQINASGKEELGFGSEGDNDCWWSLPRGFDSETEVGAWITLSLPKTIEWMTAREEEGPILGFYLYGGEGKNGKLLATRLHKLASAGLKKPAGTKMLGEFDKEGYFYVAERDLRDVITPGALANTAALEKTLTRLVKDFTVALLPALKAVRKETDSAP